MERKEIIKDPKKPELWLGLYGSLIHTRTELEYSTPNSGFGLPFFPSLIIPHSHRFQYWDGGELGLEPLTLLALAIAALRPDIQK